MRNILSFPRRIEKALWIWILQGELAELAQQEARLNRVEDRVSREITEERERIEKRRQWIRDHLPHTDCDEVRSTCRSFI